MRIGEQINGIGEYEVSGATGGGPSGPEGSYRLRMRGSMNSRNQSPITFSASTVSIMARPGNVVNHQAVPM